MYAEGISGKNYGYNEPIFINEIRLDGLNGNALRQYFKRMLKSDDLVRFDTGIYYIHKALRLLKKSYLDSMKVIVRKCIQSTTETYGYFAGATFANQIGLTTQMPATLETITSKEGKDYDGRQETYLCEQYCLRDKVSGYRGFVDGIIN